jgi:hypothetical protein
MRNPEIAMNKLEKLEGKLKTMYVMLTRPGTTADQYNKFLLNQKRLLLILKQ